jgi:putative PEP-CTERM system TPR-repeat lipoprotein
MQRSVHQRRPSPRRLSALASAVLLAALIGAPGAAGAEEAEDEAARAYEQGLQAFSAGEYRTAVIHLKNVLQLDSTILSAHILLGRAYVEEGSGDSAERQFTTALELGADRSLVYPALGRAYILQRKYEQALDEIFPGTGDPKADAEILSLRGDSHFALGELDLASDAFAKAAALMPKDTAHLLGKAKVLLKKNEYDAAEAEVIAAIELDANDPKLWLGKGSIAHVRGDLQAALADYDRALDLDPENETVRFARLGVLVDSGNDQEAAEAVKKYREDFPGDARAAYLLAVVLSRLGDGEGTRQALEEAYAILSPVPNEIIEAHVPSFLLSGVLSYSLGKLEEARIRLERFIDTYPPAPGARKLLGAVLLKQGSYSSAVEVLEPVLELEPRNPRLLLMLGEAFMREGRHYPAGELFERAVRLRPDSADARFSRAVSRLASGQESKAVEELSMVFDEQPGYGRIGTLLVDLHIERGNAAAAEEVAARLVEVEPDVMAHRNQLALALLGSGRVGEARQALEEILLRDPTYTAAELNLAKLDLMSGRVEHASARYETILRRLPHEPRATIGLARTRAAQGRTEEAVVLLEKVGSGQGNITEEFRLDASGLLVRLLIGTGEAERALEIAERAELLDPEDPRVLESLGNAHRALGDKIMAQSLYRRLSTDAGYESVRLLKIARLQFLAEDLGGALWTISKAVQADPALLVARVKQVELLAALGKTDDALEAARALAGERPESPESHRVLGDVLMSVSDGEAGLAAYQRAAELAPSEAAVLRVYRAHRALKQEAAARDLLEKRLAGSPADRRVREALAEDYMRAGEWDPARREYEKLIDSGAGTAVHLNNLAIIYARDGDPRAMELARRANELEPDSAATNDTLGWLLVRTGEVERGLGLLRKAEARAAQSPEIRYHIAVAMHALGRLDEAREALDGALDSGRPFDGDEEARGLLRELTP